MSFEDVALADFEKALTPLHNKDWKKAQELFQKVVETAEQPELAARARVMLVICDNNLGKPVPPPDSYVEALMAKNRGELDEALAICERNPNDGDFAYLGAAIAALKGDADSAMSHLGRAIDKDRAHRVHAFHDTDFDLIRDDPRFGELFD